MSVQIPRQWYLGSRQVTHPCIGLWGCCCSSTMFGEGVISIYAESFKTSLCGRMKLISNCFSVFLRGFVFFMYSFNMDSGHSLGSGLYSWITTGLHFWPGLVVFVWSSNWNWQEVVYTVITSKESEYLACSRCPVTSNSSITNFNVKDFNGRAWGGCKVLR